MERMSVHLSICWASIGMVSLNWMPDTLVLMGLNSPRTLDGASGLGSQMSMWLGPPWRKTRITDLAELNPRAPSSREAPCAFCHWKKFARFNPNRPTEPTRRSSRRVGPSHKQPLRPGIVSMETSCLSPVVQKRFTVRQRPEQILRPRGTAFAGSQESKSRVVFLGRGKLAQGRQIQFFNNRAIRRSSQNQLGYAALGVGDGIGNRPSIHQVQ